MAGGTKRGQRWAELACVAAALACSLLVVWALLVWAALPASGAPAAAPEPTQVLVAAPAAGGGEWADGWVKILRELGTLVAAILAAYGALKANAKGADNRERLERVERELAGHRAASAARFQAISTGVVTPEALRSKGGPDGETTGTGTTGQPRTG